LYTFGRFWTEYLRIDPAHRYLGLRLNDWTSVGVFAVSSAVLLLKGRAKPGDELVGDELPPELLAGERARALRASRRGDRAAPDEPDEKAGSGPPADLAVVSEPAPVEALPPTVEEAPGPVSGQALPSDETEAPEPADDAPSTEVPELTEAVRAAELPAEEAQTEVADVPEPGPSETALTEVAEVSEPGPDETASAEVNDVAAPTMEEAQPVAVTPSSPTLAREGDEP
jgi:hypothetical protein